MRLTYEYDWQSEPPEYTVSEAVDRVCDDRLSEGEIECLKSTVAEQGKLLGRLLERLADNNLLSGDDLRAVLGGGWRIKR